MLRQGLSVFVLVLGPLAALVAAEQNYFGPIDRMGFQATASDAPTAPMPPNGSSYAGDQFGEEVNAITAEGWSTDSIGGPDCELPSDGFYGPPRGFWGQVEALTWWVRGSQAPPLLTTSPTGTPTSMAGVLPNASIVFPTADLNRQGRFGGRFTLGYWMDDNETAGFQGSYFQLVNQNHSFSTGSSSSGSPILARPFYNTATQAEDAGLLAYPGLLSGSAGIATTVRLLGADFNFREALWICRGDRVDMLAGYRFLRFDDSLSMATNSTGLAGSAFPGTSIGISDSFGTQNQFNGGQFGLMWQRQRSRWTFDATGKLALGGLNERVTANGSTVVSVPGSPPTTLSGGFLALGSNSGTYGRTIFSMIPELNTNLSVQLSPIWRLNIGYTLLYVTQVLRASDQIDRHIDPAQFPPGVAGTSPQRLLHGSDLWVQGISVGLECRF